MKQTVQPEASQAKKNTGPTRSGPTQQYATASGGHLAQLAKMVNGSPCVQALTQMKEDIQRSARVQSLQQLAAAHLSESVRSPLPAGETAQFKIGIAGTLAHGDRAAGQDNAMEDHGSSAAESPSSSPCGCSAKQEAAQKKSNGVERTAPVQLEEKPAPAPNRTGLPDQLKSGVENLSGLSLDDVKVHYNSAHPAQLNALAYAQGTDIHVGPGQEKHLPHESWHVVQQKQGRVRPTMQMKAGTPVNDDAGLEHEADVMGAKALQTKAEPATATQPDNMEGPERPGRAMDALTAREGVNSAAGGAVAQRATKEEMEAGAKEFNLLRTGINALMRPFGGAQLSPWINKLYKFAKYVFQDDDHEIHKSAYGRIYDFTDNLLTWIYENDRSLVMTPAEGGKSRSTALENQLQTILELMRAGTARAHRLEHTKYTDRLRKVGIDGAGLERVIAQAAYMSGDMFGVAAALRLDPKLGVVIFYDHLLNEHREIEDRLLDFYKTKDGGEHPRVSLMPVTDSAAAYKNAIAGDFTNADLFPYGTPSILSTVGSCLSIGNATKIVAKYYTAGASAARAELEKEWLPEGAKEGTAKGRSPKTIAQWVTEKGFDKRLSYAFIWFRQSGAKGGAHKELDTSEKATQQIIEVAKSGLAADKLVIIGDKGHSLSKIADIDLTEFWNEADSPFEGSGRKMQLALFAYLVHNEFKIMNIGMRSGALEGPALLGVKTVFLEEKYNFQEGRMDQWQGVVPGFTRIELEHVPTKAGKTELDRLIGLTVEARGAEYLAAVAEINRLRAGTWSLVETQGQILKAAYKRLDAARGIYEPEDVSTVLTNILKGIETGTKKKISVLFAAQKGPILAEMRKAIRALQELQKAKVKKTLVEAYEGPEEGLSKADVEKMWAAIGTRVGGWSAPVRRPAKKKVGK